MPLQNVDRLHHKADSMNIVELHGTTHRHAPIPLPLPLPPAISAASKHSNHEQNYDCRFAAAQSTVVVSLHRLYEALI